MCMMLRVGIHSIACMSRNISEQLTRGAGDLGVYVKINKTFLNFSEYAKQSRQRRHSQPTKPSLNRPLQHSYFASTMDTISSDGEDCCASPVPSAAHPDAEYSDAECLTTVMIRNIPNRFSQDELISMLRELRIQFNFFYCPIDYRHKCNLGYFFVNLVAADMANDFIRMMDGSNWPDPRSRKLCSATWARIQGYEANMKHYRGSPIMNMAKIFRPRIFSEDGSVALEDPRSTKKEIQPRTALSTRKVFVGGLPNFVSQRAIKSHLEQFGEVEDVTIIYDSATRLSRGFSFVTFVDPASVERCVSSKDAHVLQGKALGIRPYSMLP